MMPIEAANLLWEPPNHMSISDVRAKLNEIAARKSVSLRSDDGDQQGPGEA
jgi:hypothetical protein